MFALPLTHNLFLPLGIFLNATRQTQARRSPYCTVSNVCQNSPLPRSLPSPDPSTLPFQSHCPKHSSLKALHFPFSVLSHIIPSTQCPIQLLFCVTWLRHRLLWEDFPALLARARWPQPLPKHPGLFLSQHVWPSAIMAHSGVSLLQYAAHLENRTGS